MRILQGAVQLAKALENMGCGRTSEAVGSLEGMDESLLVITHVDFRQRSAL